MSETKTLPVPPANDDEARDLYRAVLERAGYESPVAESIAQDIFSIFAAPVDDVAPNR